MPSAVEGFGLVYVEAAFHAIPSIGLRTTGVGYAILDGQTGLLAEPNDQASLNDAVLKLIEDENLRKALGINARERAVREFAIEGMIDRYERLLCK